jgi:hypothetical protein
MIGREAQFSTFDHRPGATYIELIANRPSDRDNGPTEDNA